MSCRYCKPQRNNPFAANAPVICADNRGHVLTVGIAYDYDGHAMLESSATVSGTTIISGTPIKYCPMCGREL